MAVTDRTPGAAPTPEAVPAAATGDPRLAAALTPLPSRDPSPDRRDPDRVRRVRSRIGRALITALLVGFALLFLYPFAWLLAASLKPRGEVFDNSLWPRTFTPHNYVEVWEQLPLLGWMGNSLAIALLSAALVSISSALVAFGFAYFRFPGRRILFGLVLATMMLPGAVTMVPQFLIWKNLGLIGTWIPLFGMNLFGSAFYIFLQRQFFLGLPRELFEAARLDGASYFGMFRRIALPLSIPSFVIIFIFEFQASWNNLQASLIYLNAGSVEGFTVPLGLSYAMTAFSPTNGGQGDYQLVMVAALLVTLPMLLLFAFGQRYFVEGIATQGRKG
ncbi:carbohydrate ABC transporter permease [Clavibacter michiganensis]|uniref:carbohydrate ABC transporter permease n=1 Tax=Clavibacter michiganensis TaxID=28447 RepID=UPI000CE84FF2|nr:carbohydrate ABC transporter permease [Clavibacter michiganensis]PPF85770.1 carbohydrate ABC transporter permease [Clavibacter michiganensis]PPF99747.1 carbohydrate ABC transporter permease [Clavibacter michiganensis]